jgi:hypothetical protein
MRTHGRKELYILKKRPQDSHIAIFVRLRLARWLRGPVTLRTTSTVPAMPPLALRSANQETAKLRSLKRNSGLLSCPGNIAAKYA